MGAWHIYPGASTVVSQPLDSSPMAGKSPQPSHDPLFQAPVTLKQDETVEGDIEGGWGDAKKNRFTLTQPPQKPLHLTLLAVTKRTRSM